MTTGTPRTVSADEALSVVHPGMTVATTSLSAEPVALLEALGRRCAQAAPITLVSGMLIKGYQALTPHLGNEIELQTWFMPQTLLGDVGLGPNVDFLPLTWVQTYNYAAAREFDVCLIQVSPADADGNHSVGISSSMTRLLTQRSKVVIAQLNSEMPYTIGDTLVHSSEIDFLVEHAAPLPAFPHRTPDERSATIAGHVADLIPDGATVQAGVGTIPESVLAALADAGRRDLLLTSIFTDGGRALIEAGCCVDDGPAAIVGEIMGTTDLYRWMDHNPRVSMQHTLNTHSLPALAQRSSLVSINSTLEVDLYGQLNSEVVGTGQAGGIGGSVDFMMGAQLPGHKSIIALPSTTNRGAPKIVPVIDRGLVTVPRSLVQFVVTEFGIADLRGKTARERARELIAVSHPDHRDDLEAAAKAL